MLGGGRFANGAATASFQYVASDIGVNGLQAQSAASFSAYSLGCDSEGTLCDDPTLNTIPYRPMASGATSQEAPPYMIQGPYDFRSFAQHATKLNMGLILAEFSVSGIGGGAVLSGGVAVLPLLRGPVLGAALNITSRVLWGSTEVDEGAEIAITTLEKLEAEFTSIEIANPEVAGPEIPWSVH